MKIAFASVFSAALVALASAHGKDGNPRLPSGWREAGMTPRGTKVELVFAVKQRNLAQLEETFLAVSDPLSSSYGQHLSNERVHQMIAPSQESVGAVVSFLDSHGVQEYKSMTPNSDFIVAEVTVEKAEELLAPKGKTYTAFYHPEGHTVHRLRVSDDDLTLPENVRNAVDLVAPTSYVPSVRTMRRDVEAAESPNALFNTPKVLRNLYGVDAEGKSGKYKQAVTGFLDQTFSESSLATFYKLFCGANQSFTCGQGSDATKVVCKGDECKGAGGTESMLDIEYITATGAGVATEFWGFSGRNPYQKQDEPFLKWLYLVGNTTDDDVPKLFSTSYGEDEDLIPLAWSKRTNVEFQKCGARGISLLFASGDSGAAGDSGCHSGEIFVPQWPSGSPYVTAVGGSSGSAPEVVAGLSSGGFSNRWDRPSWQKDAVSDYLTGGTKLPDGSHFNSTGRGFPDIAAQAVKFVVVQFGIPLPGVSGTSCASPTAAGIFGLLNDQRAQAGKAPLDFLIRLSTRTPCF